MDSHDPAARAAALRKVGPPGVAIAVVAGIDGLFSIVGLIWYVLQIAGTPIVDLRGDERAWWFLSGVWGAAWSLFAVGICAFVLWAGLKMRELASYPLAMAACVISVVPCLSPCCILGVPIGIWGLIVMHDPAVRPHFRA